MFFKSKTPSLKQCKQILYTSNKLYQKKRRQLSESDLATFEELLGQLQSAIEQSLKESAAEKAQELEEFCDLHFPKKPFFSALEFGGALTAALVVAIIARMMWFELYVIPTGSMRPTFKEKDRLIVSKTQFGLNIPLQTNHFTFSPDNVKRGGIVIWSGDGVDLPDVDDYLFNIVPFKKRFVKRMIGKPGDSLYFYGGKIYGVDASGNDLSVLREAECMASLEHVPIINLEGDIDRLNYPSDDPVMLGYLFKYANQPILKLHLKRAGGTEKLLYVNEEWKQEPLLPKINSSAIEQYRDYFGIGNFAQARIITREEALDFSSYKGVIDPSREFFLELKHSPTPTIESTFRGIGPTTLSSTSLIPLTEQHLNKIMDTLYSCRFVIKNERGARYNQNQTSFSKRSPTFKGVDDGVYELYYGKGYKIGFGGHSSELKKEHPLLERTPENIQKLFNLGIEMDLALVPNEWNRKAFPTRFAYYRKGSLYLMGQPIFAKEDPILKEFVEKEIAQKGIKTAYIPFIDRGAPLKEDRSIDTNFIQTFGLKVPEGHYFVLGDNHAMSLDSRRFGFVPQANLQGVPEQIIWPLGERWGAPSQVDYPLFTPYRIFVWLIVAGVVIALISIQRRKMAMPIYKKLLAPCGGERT